MDGGPPKSPPAEQAAANPAKGGKAAAGGPSSAQKRKAADPAVIQTQKLEGLKQFFEENDVEFAPGWRAEVHVRSGGTSAGTSDTYFFSPDGRRYRSKAEVARDFGIEVKDRAPRRITLTREEAIGHAQARAHLNPTPIQLTNGVTITKLGTVKPEYVAETSLPLIGYAAHWMDTKEVIFSSRVYDPSGTGPYYKVRAKHKELAGGAWAELGNGPSPEAAWQAAIERQAEVLEQAAAHRRESSPADDMELGDQVLLRAASLAGQWGLDRFGLSDPKVLQAMEGQPGVEATVYKYVEQRGGWKAEEERLNREMIAHGQRPLHKPARRRIDSNRPKTKAERDAATVHGVMERMIRQLEGMEHKAVQRREKTQVKMLERAAKEREREQANQTVDDEALEKAAEPPPMPLPLAKGALPASAEPVLLEAWHLARRFADQLGVNPADIPTIGALEASLAGKPLPTPSQTGIDPAAWFAITLVDFLVSDLFKQAASEIARDNVDVAEKDLKPAKQAQHPLHPITYDTWQEAAHRLLATLAEAAAVWGKDDRAGMPEPTDPLEPFLVLQYLTAGAPTALMRGWAGLPPKDTSQHAWLAPVVRTDAAALAAAGLPGGPVERAAEEVTAITQLQRCILRQLLCGRRGDKATKHSRLLCFQGHSAGASTKLGRSLDLRAVAARVDAGVYARAPDPMAAFKADIHFVAQLHQAAARKHTSGFFEMNRDKGVEEAAALMVSHLEAALEEVQRSGAEAYLQEHAPPLHKHHGGAEGSHAAEENGVPPESDPVRDLRRPFAPWHLTCCECWDGEDEDRLLQCCECAVIYHSYCLDPPLEEVPQGEWKCPGCDPSPAPAAEASFARFSDGAAVWEMAQALGTTDWERWTPAQRASLLHMLCTLVADSPALHELMKKEETEEKDAKKELHTKRQELKHKQQEAAGGKDPQQQKQKGAAKEGSAAKEGAKAPEPNGAAAAEAAQPAPPARVSARAAREAAAEMESLVQRISELEHEVTEFQPHRLEPLGLDRHFNRYWLLPGAACGPDKPGAIIIERHHLDPLTLRAGAKRAAHHPGAAAASSSSPSDDSMWQVGMYSGAIRVSELIQWLNPQGKREHALMKELRKARARMKEEMEEKQRAKEAGQGPTSPAQAAPMDEAKDPAAAAAAAAAAALPPLERIRAMLLDTEELMPAAARMVDASSDAMQAWRARAASADSPQAMMAAIVSLEQAIFPHFLKPHWRPWSMPLPHPESARTLSAVWLRMVILREAISKKVKFTTSNLLEAKIDLPRLRADRGAKGEGGAGKRKSGAADSLADSGAEGSVARAERASKRVRGSGGEGSGSDADEALARRLDAELNSGPRIRSSRLRNASSAREERVQKGHSLRGGTGRSYREPSESEFEDGVEEDEEAEDQAAAMEQDGGEEEEGAGDGGGAEEEYQPSEPDTTGE